MLVGRDEETVSTIVSKQKMLTALATLKGSTTRERAFLVTATLELEYVFLIFGQWQNNWDLHNKITWLADGPHTPMPIAPQVN